MQNLNQSLTVTVTHGIATDCNLANANLISIFKEYNFIAYCMELGVYKCPNNNCNQTFVFILPKNEYFRLRHAVSPEPRPTVLYDYSYKKVMKANVNLSGKDQMASIGVQMSPQMVNVAVDCVPTSAYKLSQTDDLKKDQNLQTDKSHLSEVGCQANIETVEKSVDVNQNHLLVPSQPVARVEEGEDNDVIFLEKRRSDHVFSMLKDVKQEEEEEDDSSDTSSDSSRSSDSSDSSDDSNDALETADEASEVAQAAPEVPEAPKTPEAPEAPEDVREIKQEPPEEVETLSASLSSAVLKTPQTPRVRRVFDSSCSEGDSVKRKRFTETEQCQSCWALTQFDTIDEYCAHILDSHTAVLRFKCSFCSFKFIDSIRGKKHVETHVGQSGGGDGAQLLFEIPLEQYQKFHKVASQCYPEKFRGVSDEKLIEVLNNIP